MEWLINKIGYIREQENESGLFNILKAAAVPFLNKDVK